MSEQKYITFVVDCVYLQYLPVMKLFKNSYHSHCHKSNSLTAGKSLCLIGFLLWNKKNVK